MEIPSGLASGGWLLVSWAVYLFVTALAVLRAPWPKLLERDSANVYFGAIVVLLLFWSLWAGLLPGQTFHFLGASAACLMFGWAFALLAVQVLVVATTLRAGGGWDSFALTVVLSGVIPVFVTHGVRLFAQRFLPPNIFVYLFLNAFFAASLGVLLAGALAWIVLLSSGAYTAAELGRNFLPILILLALPEGTLNGIAMTVLVVYKPRWVATFSDKLYLKRPDQ